MPSYTFAPAPVLVESTGAFAIGATGVLRATEGGDPVPIFDLNGSPLTSIQVGPKGAHQGFTADIPNGVLDFGSVLLPSISLEQQESGLTAVAVANAASDTAAAAEATVQDIQSDMVATVTHDGTAGGGVRPSGYAYVIWRNPPNTSYGRPTNMVAGDVWRHNA